MYLWQIHKKSNSSFSVTSSNPNRAIKKTLDAIATIAFPFYSSIFRVKKAQRNPSLRQLSFHFLSAGTRVKFARFAAHVAHTCRSSRASLPSFLFFGIPRRPSPCLALSFRVYANEPYEEFPRLASKWMLVENGVFLRWNVESNRARITEPVIVIGARTKHRFEAGTGCVRDREKRFTVFRSECVTIQRRLRLVNDPPRGTVLWSRANLGGRFVTWNFSWLFHADFGPWNV